MSETEARGEERDRFRQKNADRKLCRSTTPQYAFMHARSMRRHATGPVRGAFGRAPARWFNELAIGTTGLRRRESSESGGS